MSNFWDDAEVIYAYTPENAIDDGLWVPVDESLSKEAGFRIPVYITCGLDAIVKDLSQGEDVTGRMWDILFVLRVRAAGSAGQLIDYSVKIGKTVHQLKAGVTFVYDNPAIIISLPEED